MDQFKSDFRKDFDKALYYYETTLKNKYAGRTRQMLKKYGPVETISRIVTKKKVSQGFTKLVEIGQKKYTFESIVLRHSWFFSPDVVLASAKTMAEAQ